MSEEKATCGQCMKFHKYPSKNKLGFCEADAPRWAEVLVDECDTANEFSKDCEYAEDCLLFNPVRK